MTRTARSITGALAVLVMAVPGFPQPFGRPAFIGIGAPGFSSFDVATDGAGLWLATACSGSTRRSSDDGGTWTSVDTGTGCPLAVAGTAGGTWLLGHFGAVGPYVKRSSDGGLTWGPSVLVGEGYWASPEALVTDGAGTWITNWLEEGVFIGRHLSRSADDGITWGVPPVLSFELSGSDLATTGSGTWVAAFTDRSSAPPRDFDVSFARSVDNGLTWSPPAFLNTTASSDVVDDFGVALVTDGSQTWGAAWIAGNDVVVARSVDDGTTWSTPLAIAADAGPGRAAPSIAASGSDWIVVWTETTEFGGSVIKEARSSDGAASWSAPACVTPGCRFTTSGRRSPFVNVRAAVVRARAGGGWLAAWDADAEGPYTPEFAGPRRRDIAVARSSVPCASDADCQRCERCTESGVCVLGARPGCRSATLPGKGSLVLGAPETAPQRHRIVWKLTRGEATSVGNFGDPTTVDAYSFCLFDESAATTDLLYAADIPAGGLCNGRPCWRGTPSGYRHLSKPSSAIGVRSVELKGGSEGRTKVGFRGEGEALQARLLGLPLSPLPMPLRVQLQAANGACWEATFSTASRNQRGLFKARAD